MYSKLLEKYIKSNNCFKLILGAGNEDFEQIERFVALYSLAGCVFFDINASVAAINAVYKGFLLSERQGYICASIGVKDDIHFSKCKINNVICTNCKKCTSVCLQNAIVESDKFLTIDERKCIGCNKCKEICPFSSIDSYQKEIDFTNTVDIIKDSVDCIEFHISSQNYDEIYKKWEYLTDNYSGYLSIAINRVEYGDNKIKEILNNLLKIRRENVMIQADGAPMSGGIDDYKTTLQAVACADIIRKTVSDIPIIVSGGTNLHTRKLLNICNIDIQGIAIGSLARKAVSNYIARNDFYKNKEVFNKALEIAKNIIDSTKENFSVL